MTSLHSLHRAAAESASAHAPRRDLGAVALRVIVVITGLAPVAGHPGPMPVIIVGIPFAILAAGRRYGWRLGEIYLAITLTVASAFENLSISTGFPFGHYPYPASSGVDLRIGHFPVMVALFYCALGMICWLVAAALLDGADRRLADRTDHARRVNIAAMPILAAALMTMYDLGSDSVSSTIKHTRVWEHGGGVFGVPWTNYLGSFFVTYVRPSRRDHDARVQGPPPPGRRPTL